MSLLHLPPEALRQIFDEIGSSFFHEDLRRLTVCKQWFEFALPTCLKCITLSQTTLRSLMASGVTKRPSPLQNNLETLHLELRGDRLCISTSYPPEYTQESNALVATAPNEAPGNNPIKRSITALKKDLDQLAIITQQSHRLHTLRIRAWGFPYPEPFDSAEGYLPLPTMQALLLVGNLRVLVLDLSTGFLNSAGQQGNGHHICPAISALLCTLRTLHLRMRSICPDVLIPRDPNISLHLSEVVINLSLTEKLPGITSAAHSKRCGSQGGGLLQLKADLFEQAEALATQMVFPKVMRILTHSLPQFETNSLDVLSGKTMILEDGSAWDEDGKTVEEGSETESEIILDDEVSTLLDE
ncbi:hypothetical protein B0T24DRAFT_600347 [Lasiosphaeria ovina]|uniref:F-box domain-containing protein n=1 Tax=Lasiosphaeria ovina TaxID=92902 RepID=A0AAE0NIC5_9PEZI|nr:hypothetical protein B0T24DRAFT_600347 [Lasiosphaeria ovina]